MCVPRSPHLLMSKNKLNQIRGCTTYSRTTSIDRTMRVMNLVS